MSWPCQTSLTSSGATVLLATGRLTFPGVAGLRQQLAGLVGGGTNRLVVDLSEVEAIDSSGVGALIAGWKAARNAGGDLRLAAPSEAIAHTLDIMNLGTILISHESPEVAFPHLV